MTSKGRTGPAPESTRSRSSRWPGRWPGAGDEPDELAPITVPQDLSYARADLPVMLTGFAAPERAGTDGSRRSPGWRASTATVRPAVVTMQVTGLECLAGTGQKVDTHSYSAEHPHRD
jgi:hypothetical protein